MKIVAGVSIVWWLALGGIVLNHNLALSGSPQLNWPNPAKATAHFTWQAEPQLDDGVVTLPPNESRRFSVSLQRGFSSGELKIIFVPNQGTIATTVTAETLPDVSPVSATGRSAELLLPVEWSGLVARARTFSFTIRNDHPSAWTQIASIHVTLQTK